MIKVINIIKNCKSLYFLANNIIYTIEVDTISTFLNNKSTNHYLSILNLSVYNNKLYYYNDSKLYNLVGNELIEVFTIVDVDGIEIVSENILFTWKKLSRKEYVHSFYDFNYKKLWENIGDEVVDIINEKYVKLRGRLEIDINSFTVRDIKNGNSNWSYTLPEGFKIYLSIETIQNILYFTAYNEHQKKQLVTGLDIETGKVIWQHNFEVTSEQKFISATAFNKKDQLYYGIGIKYQVFNPKTGEIVLEKIFDECKDYNLLVDAQAVYDNKLWFVAGGGKNTKFGYVNIDTHQLEFLQDLPHEEYEVFDTPVFHEGKLYLRGKHQNNLYVFE